MKNFLSFLSSRDKETLIGVSSTKEYADGETILTQGDKNTALHIISKGCVSVVSSIMGHDMEIERLYENDVLGDLSFIDSDPASADVVADGPVTINFVSVKDIETIIRNEPLFYGRFYHAIAKVLSHRLREENKKAEQYMSTG